MVLLQQHRVTSIPHRVGYAAQFWTFAGMVWCHVCPKVLGKLCHDIKRTHLQKHVVLLVLCSARHSSHPVHHLGWSDHRETYRVVCNAHIVLYACHTAAVPQRRPLLRHSVLSMGSHCSGSAPLCPSVQRGCCQCYQCQISQRPGSSYESSQASLSAPAVRTAAHTVC